MISSSVSPDEASILMFCSLPVPLSFAETFRIPLASISKVTSTWGIPLGAGGMPSKWNLPIVLLSFAMGLSPCKTWISTDGWLSAAVEKLSDFFVGMVVLDSISLVNTPPNVSIPNDRGVTSKSKTSFTSPVNTPPWIAAPIATTSSGFTPLDGFFLKNFSTSSCIFGILVDPPTRIISSISDTVILASFKAFLQGFNVLETSFSDNCSNLDLESVFTKCLGTPSTGIIYGKFISVEVELDNSILAFSAPSLSLWSAIGSFLRSIPSSFLNSSASQSINTLSKSSPPRWTSPFVDFTSKTPSPNSKIEISKVPPPKSYTAILMSLSFLSNPYARAAAVGSFIIRFTSSPAMVPASLVACLSESLKYAGTVITASLISEPI